MSNSVINLPTLISKVAAGANVDMATSRRFLHELFALIESRLCEGKSVSVDGIGEFARGFGHESAVVFKPADSLASAVNAPFSAFRPVELNDGAEQEISTDSYKEPEAITEPQPEPEEKKVVAETTEVIAPGETDQHETEKETETEPEEKPDVEPEKEPEPVRVVTPPITIIPPVPPAPPTPRAPEPVFVQKPNKSNNILWLILGLLIGLILGLVGGYFAGKEMGRVEGRFWDDEDEDTEFVEETTPDTVVEQEVLPEAVTEEETVDAPEPEKEIVKPEPVYDTVKTTLSALAVKHYGEKDYWVYIYKANPQIDNPDRIATGTRLLIPPYEEFAAATKEETKANARKLLSEISR